MPAFSLRIYLLEIRNLFFHHFPLRAQYKEFSNKISPAIEFAHSPIYSPVYLFIHPSKYVIIFPAIHTSIYPSIYPCIYPPMHPFIHHVFIHLSTHPLVHPSVHPSTDQPHTPPIYQHPSVSLSSIII